MKKLIVLLIATLLVSCGVSTKDKEYMTIVLDNELTELYNKEGMQLMFLDVEMRKFNDSPYVGIEEGYYCHFYCSFEDGEDKVSFYGMAGFDKNMNIAKMPQYYGDNKLAIDIHGPLIINQKFEISMPDDCKYILNCFMNRNKITGNE